MLVVKYLPFCDNLLSPAKASMQLPTRYFSTFVMATLSLSSIAIAEPTTPEQVEFFESRIRPVLVERCYECHNSVETAEGGFALDQRDALLKGGDSGIAVKPGDVAASRILRVIRHEIDGQEMPEDGPKLSDEVIADFAKWIEMGAPDPREKAPTAEELGAATSWAAKLDKRKQWWSFRPIRPTSQPESGADWSKHPIDQFTFAKMQSQGLTPANLANDYTLVRRITFALTGLPPTSDQIDRFVRDTSAARVESFVDELLQTSSFGERWARHWMDWIRYAESHGSEGDPEINNAWHYRDYLIRALNADVPYDQLVREHVAGDLLDTPRINQQLEINESVIGTAHWRMVFHGFAPTDALDERVRFTDDQINAFSKAFLGLTISCARCHDHKFDAISQADYYALYGILNACRPGRLAIDLPKKLDRNREELAERKAEIRKAVSKDWRSNAESVSERLTANDELWKEAKDSSSLLFPWFRLKQAAEEGKSFDDVWSDLKKDWRQNRQAREEHAYRDYVQRWDLTGNDYNAWYKFGTGLSSEPSLAGEFVVALEENNAISTILPAGVYSQTLSDKHAARLSSPDWELNGEYTLWMRVKGENSTARYAVQDYPRNGTVYPVNGLNTSWRWQKFNLDYWNGDDIHVELATGKDAPLLVKGDDRGWFGVREVLFVKKDQAGPPENPNEHFDVLLDDVSELVDSFPALARLYQRNVEEVIEGFSRAEMTDARAIFLDECLKVGLLSNDLNELSNVRPLIEEYRTIEKEVVAATRIPALEETATTDQPLFERGDPKRPGQIVPRRFLEAIDSAPYGNLDSGRRQLAEDLLRDDNPLTRRVIVNRIWHHLFGRGIVATPDNLGQLGSPPTHPELLDFLAIRFSEESDWSLKSMIRFIMTSKTWQLDSLPSEKALAMDPDNTLLSHARVRRLEAEAIRDSLLAVSGRLSDDAYGPPVNGDSDRRSVYVGVRRNQLDSFLRVFDFPEPYTATGRRDSTNVPAQSLTLMNDDRIRGYADAWSKRLATTDVNTSSSDQAKSMIANALGRPALESEAEQAARFVHDVQIDAKHRFDRRNELQDRVDQLQASVAKLISPARDALVKKAGLESNPRKTPNPVAQWDFAEGTEDTIGAMDLRLEDQAKVVEGSLSLNGERAHANSEPLPFDLGEKTLEAWVQLSNLQQRGSGVMTIQTTDGVTFDSIVFAERESKQWMAGSDGFGRTRSLEGPAEEAALEEFIHVAIVYKADGQVVAYRNGLPYGSPYVSSGPVHFKAGKAVVSFGVRHFPAVDGRMLAGKIKKANLYDRALSDQEVWASAGSKESFIPEPKVIASLSSADQMSITTMRDQIAALTSQIEGLGSVPDAFDERQAWSELARAIFSLKEFIYVK